MNEYRAYNNEIGVQEPEVFKATREKNKTIGSVLSLIKEEIDLLHKSTEHMMQVVNPVLGPDFPAVASDNKDDRLSDRLSTQEPSVMLRELLTVLSSIKIISMKITNTASRVQL